jgi:hypothetical protein
VGALLSVGQLVHVSGWVVDSTAQGWTGVDDVQLFAGTMDAGTSLGHASLGLSRPDVAASLNNPYWSTAGFGLVLDPAGLPPGPNTLTVYAHTPSKGWWYTQVAVTVGGSAGSGAGPRVPGSGPVITVNAPVDGQVISTHVPQFLINGSATDPVTGPRAIDWVELWLDGERDTPGAFFLGAPSLNSDGSWTLDFSPWNYPAITSNLYVYAHSDVTGKIGLTLIHFNISDHVGDH